MGFNSGFKGLILDIADNIYS